jgi:hypothetical protein
MLIAFLVVPKKDIGLVNIRLARHSLMTALLQDKRGRGIREEIDAVSSAIVIKWLILFAKLARCSG